MNDEKVVNLKPEFLNYNATELLSYLKNISEESHFKHVVCSIMTEDGKCLSFFTKDISPIESSFMLRITDKILDIEIENGLFNHQENIEND